MRGTTAQESTEVFKEFAYGDKQHIIKLSVANIRQLLKERITLLNRKGAGRPNLKTRIDLEKSKNKHLYSNICSFNHYTLELEFETEDSDIEFCTNEREINSTMCDWLFPMLNPPLLISLAMDVSSHMINCDDCWAQQLVDCVKYDVIEPLEYEIDFEKIYDEKERAVITSVYLWIGILNIIWYSFIFGLNIFTLVHWCMLITLITVN